MILCSSCHCLPSLLPTSVRFCHSVTRTASYPLSRNSVSLSHSLSHSFSLYPLSVCLSLCLLTLHFLSIYLSLSILCLSVCLSFPLCLLTLHFFPLSVHLLSYTCATWNCVLLDIHCTCILQVWIFLQLRRWLLMISPIVWMTAVAPSGKDMLGRTPLLFPMVWP